MVLPNFFIVGAAKCGTTTFYTSLPKHPDIFFPSVKEPQYFDTDALKYADWYVHDAESYAHLYEGAKGFQVAGDASPMYLASEVAAARIYAFNPEAKILISLRNPVDFMFSHHRELVSGCNEDIKDFETALDAEQDRAAGIRIPPETNYPRKLLYRESARFTEQVERYLQQFGPEQVKVILLDDLKQDSQQVCKDVLDFLGVNSNVSLELSPANVGAEKRIRNFRVRTWLKRNPKLRKLAGYLPEGLRGRVGDTLAKVSKDQIDTTAKMDPELRKRLLVEFEPEILSLGKLINRDLSHWLK